jgi:hypothetical protein
VCVGRLSLKRRTASNSDLEAEDERCHALAPKQQYLSPPSETSRGRTSAMKRYGNTASFGDRHLTGAVESCGDNSPITGAGRGKRTCGTRKERGDQSAGCWGRFRCSCAVPLCAHSCGVRCRGRRLGRGNAAWGTG